MKSQKGQAMVETALTIPLVLMILFGIADFGRIFHAYLTLDHAGREAARLASLQNTDSVIYTKIENSVVGLDKTKLIKSIAPANRPSGIDVTISLSYDIELLTPFFSSLASPITVTDTTVMRVE
jgi:Flp pilus assembly protein TadG